MRVCVLTTSYPRTPGESAGAFVADQVEGLRRVGAEVTVVSPADFRHYGVAFGAGIMQNLRARPWLVLVLPLFFVSYVRTARKAGRSADVVHAHWLPSALPALATGKPFVLQLWGSDVALARRTRPFARLLLRRAGRVVGASAFLADEARALGARSVAVVPMGIELPQHVAVPASPPHVLYVGRLSEEKGILEFLAASEGLPRVIVGDGPLRGRVPGALGFVAHDRLGEYYARATVVCVPSRREGYGMAAREAMAHGRAVVASSVGGLRDAVLDGVTGRLVEPGRPAELGAAIRELLDDPRRSAWLGANAREVAERDYSWPAASASLLALYGELARRTT